MPLTECLRHVSRHTSVLRHVRVLSFATPPTLLAIAPSPEQCSAPEPHASFQFDTVLREPPQTDVLRRKPPQPAGDVTPLHFFQRSQQPQRNHQHPFHPPPGRAITSLLPHHPTHPSPLHHPPGARGVRSVAVAEEEGGQRYRTVASVGPHTVVSDMVNGEEGADSAPTAMEYALAALGLCTSMTVRLVWGRGQAGGPPTLRGMELPLWQTGRLLYQGLPFLRASSHFIPCVLHRLQYADRKGLPLKRIHVKVNPDLPSPGRLRTDGMSRTAMPPLVCPLLTVSAGQAPRVFCSVGLCGGASSCAVLCASFSSPPASHLPRSVHLALHFEGDLTAEQRQHLLFIASGCSCYHYDIRTSCLYASHLCVYAISTL